MTDILIKRGHVDIEMYTEGKQCEEMKTEGEGCLLQAKGSPSQPSEKPTLPNFDFGSPASQTVRKYISIVEATQCAVLHYSSPANKCTKADSSPYPAVLL